MRLLALAAELGWLHCLRFLHENGCPWNEQACREAAQSGHPKCLKYAHESGCPWTAETTKAAARSSNCECFNYARDYGCFWEEGACATAAMNNDLASLTLAHKSGCPWDARTCENAAYNKGTKCLKYAHTNGCPWDKNTCSVAALCGNVAVLTYAHKSGCPWDETTCEDAAGNDELACLKFAHENGCPWSVQTCTRAAKTGSFACLQYAHDQGCPWDENVVFEAARAGQLRCLQYALENGCPGLEKACKFASGSLKCLKYLHGELQCPLDIRVANACAAEPTKSIGCLKYCLDNCCPVDGTTTAASSTSSVCLAKLQLLRERGCPWTESALWAAISGSALECFEYLLEHNCPGRDGVVSLVAHNLPLLRCACQSGCELLSNAYKSALVGDRALPCIKFLFEHGCLWPRDACTWFAQAKDADCLQYAHANGAPWEASTVTAAVNLTGYPCRPGAAERSLECLQYLLEHGCPCDAAAVHTAKQSYNELCVKYLEKHKPLPVKRTPYVLIKKVAIFAPGLLDEQQPYSRGAQNSQSSADPTPQAAESFGSYIPDSVSVQSRVSADEAAANTEEPGLGLSEGAGAGDQSRAGWVSALWRIIAACFQWCAARRR